MGSLRGNVEEPISQSLPRQNSLYSLKLHEVQNHLGSSSKPLGSMNLDELLKSVWSAEANQPPEATEEGIPRQGSLTLPRDLSKKTVDEVWRDIQQDKIGSSSNPRGERRDSNDNKQPTLGEITLEDLLLKAGVVTETIAPQNVVNIASNGQWVQYHQPQHQHQGFMPYPVCEMQEMVSPTPLMMGGLSDSQHAHGRKRLASSGGEIVEKTVERRQKRMIKNRESAARSRARKQAYTHELEIKVSSLEEENEKLRRRWRRSSQVNHHRILSGSSGEQALLLSDLKDSSSFFFFFFFFFFLLELCCLMLYQASSVARSLSADPKTAISILCSKGNLREAFQRFRLNIFSNTDLFTPFIQSCVTRQSLPSGKQLHCLLVVSGFSSERFISNHLMSMYSKLGDFPSAVALYALMPKKNFMSSNVLINGYVRAGDLESARKVFDEMTDRKLTTWNAMIAGLIQSEYNEEGLSLFREMHALGFSPDEYTLGSVFSGSAGSRSLLIGQQIHAYTIKYGLEIDSVVSNSVAHMYMRTGKLQDGQDVIRSMPVSNLVAWNTLIAGYAQNGCPETVLYEYRKMKVSGFRPNQITFVTVLSSCSDLAVREHMKVKEVENSYESRELRRDLAREDDTVSYDSSCTSATTTSLVMARPLQRDKRSHPT
ncbi:unnamed protein product, partial [Thlaspi arvense]